MKRDLVDELYTSHNSDITVYIPENIDINDIEKNIQTKILHLFQIFQIHFGLVLKVNLIEMDIMLQRNMSKRQS